MIWWKEVTSVTSPSGSPLDVSSASFWGWSCWMLWKTGRRPTSTTTTACWIASPRRSYKIDTTSCKYTKNILRIRVSDIYIYISYISLSIYIHICIYIYATVSISNKYIYTGLDHLVQRFEPDSHWPTGFELEPCPGVPGEDERTEGAEGRRWPMGRCTELVVDDYIIPIHIIYRMTLY